MHTLSEVSNFKCNITRSQAINSKYWEQYNQVHVTDTQVTTTNPTYVVVLIYDILYPQFPEIVLAIKGY